MTALRETCTRQRAALLPVLAAALQTLLFRYTDQDDITLATPVTGGPWAASGLPIRTDLSGNPSFCTLLGRVRHAVNSAFAHRRVAAGPDVIGRDRADPSRWTPTVGIALRSEDDAPVEAPAWTSTLEAMFWVDEGEDYLRITLEYDAGRLDDAAMVRTIGHYKTLLEAIAAASEQPLSRLRLLTESERHQLLFDLNPPPLTQPPSHTIHRMVEAQVLSTPDAVAISSDAGDVTYRELDVRACQTAATLCPFITGPDTLVGLFMDRSIEAIVGLLGILKAGGAYVPLDPAYPAEHLTAVATDARLNVVVTRRSLLSKMPADWSSDLVVLAVDDVAGASAPASGTAIPPVRSAGASAPASASDHLAYVMYTSGSTGVPKGVMVTHRNIVHSTLARLSWYRQPVGTFVLLPSLAFDGSIAAIFWTLCTGGRLAILPAGVERDPLELGRHVAQVRASHVLCVASLYQHVLDHATADELSSLTTVVVGGEACPPAVVAQHRDKAPHASLFNEYGPTECTVWASVCDVTALPADRPLPIGRPVAATQMYILDAERQPVPAGVSGELYIGGEGVARGYLGLDEATEARFIPHPFCTIPGARLYRTGDRARYRGDGTIEWLGRLDHQVKIRGVRIELEEIESILTSHPSVQAAGVGVHSDHRGSRLVAQVVVRRGMDASPEGLRDHVARRVPTFMVPAIGMVDALPRTSSGKVDRHAILPVERPSAPAGTEDGNALERQMRSIWEDVLEVSSIGLDDNFFDLGGHSLIAVELLSRLGSLTSTPLRLASLLEAPTIRQLAAFIERLGTQPATWSRLVTVQPKGSRPPFFSIHTGLGTVFGYKALSRQLGTGQPFFALEAAGLDGERPDTRIEDMAARYIVAIRTQQPEGPYFLGGHSFGGLIAYEIAQQLHAAGSVVGMVALFNTFNPSASLARTRPYRYWGSRIRHMIRPYPERFFTEPGSILHVARQLPVQLRRLTQRRPPSPDSRLNQLLERVHQANRLAYQRYVPRPYPGVLTLFRVKAGEFGAPEDSSLGWKTLVPHVDVHEVPGEHGTMLREPHVRALAATLASRLDEAWPGPR